MQYQPKISIVVPVYNMERYLHQCIESIISQTFEDWECILVDDGSTDSSGNICDDYSKRDSRFKVIHRKNGGLSAARNSALKLVKGEYTGFIDSDDWVEPTYLQRLYELITDNGCDMVQVGYIDEYVGFSRPQHLVHSPLSLSRQEIARKLLLDHELPSFVWNKLFRSELIGPDFPEGKVFEDIYVYNIWVNRIKTAFLSPETLYHYRRRKGSLLNSRFSSSRIDYFKGVLDRKEKLRKIEPEAITDTEETGMLWDAAIMVAKDVARYESNVKLRMETLAQINRMTTDLPQPTSDALGPKKMFRARMLRDNPARFARIMRLVFITDFQTKHRNNALFD